MKEIIALFLSVIAIDSVWFFFMKTWYQKQLDFLIQFPVNSKPAILFYMLFACGLYYFVYVPYGNNPVVLTVSGLFFGIVVYSAYDLVNHATISNWPFVVTVVDMLWGGVLSGLSLFVLWNIAKLM